jgi:hypothetical protein
VGFGEGVFDGGFAPVLVFLLPGLTAKNGSSVG